MQICDAPNIVRLDVKRPKMFEQRLEWLWKVSRVRLLNQEAPNGIGRRVQWDFETREYVDGWQDDDLIQKVEGVQEEKYAEQRAGGSQGLLGSLVYTKVKPRYNDCHCSCGEEDERDPGGHRVERELKETRQTAT